MNRLNSRERITAFSVALLVSLRMYGLFLILPVFSVEAQNYEGSSAFLIGLAIGAYGLTQAIFQIPKGLASDFFGRKRILILGLLIFITGSVIAAMAETIYGVIAGRFIQGMGAIASTGMALIADVSRPEQRTKMMAIVGSSIGLAFMLAFVTAPVLLSWKGVSGLFWITAFLGFIGLIQLIILIEEPKNKEEHSFHYNELFRMMKRKELLSLNMAVFILHAAMTSVFVVIPIVLVNQFDMQLAVHWKVYLPVLIASIVIFVPMIIVYEKLKKYFLFIVLTMLGLALSIALMALQLPYFSVLIIGMILYFAFFNFLEASMPSLLSRLSGIKYKGAAMGAYSSSQFLGAFFGSTLAGLLLPYGNTTVFIVVIALALASAFYIFRNSKQ